MERLSAVVRVNLAREAVLTSGEESRGAKGDVIRAGGEGRGDVTGSAVHLDPLGGDVLGGWSGLDPSDLVCAYAYMGLCCYG